MLLIMVMMWIDIIITIVYVVDIGVI